MHVTNGTSNTRTPLNAPPGVLAPSNVANLLRQEVAELLKRSSTRFPGAQPVSFTRKHLQELQTKDYYLCEKTDGLRCLLYFTHDESGNEIHYIIDRKNDYYFITDLHFPVHDDPTFRRYHDSCLIDGELVIDKSSSAPDGKLRFYVFDCLLLDTECLTQKPLDKRLAYFNERVFKPLITFLSAHQSFVAKMPFEIRMKKMEFSYAISMMFSVILGQLPHGNDGLVFTCRETAYEFGTDEHILKWKPAHENTIDFRLKMGEFPMFDPEDGGSPIPDYEEKPPFALQLFHGNSGGRDDYRDFTELYLGDDDWEALKRLNQPLDGRILECWRDGQGRWRPKRDEDGSPRFRDDKHDANFHTVAQKVMQSIEDGVSKEDLVAVEGAIRAAWKTREGAKKMVASQQMIQQQRIKREERSSPVSEVGPERKRSLQSTSEEGPSPKRAKSEQE